MHVMDFSGAGASGSNLSASGSNQLREYAEPGHLFDHLESAGTAPRRVGDLVSELINAAIDRTQIAELDTRHHDHSSARLDELSVLFKNFKPSDSATVVPSLGS
jgi:hypothetical protein